MTAADHRTKPHRTVLITGAGRPGQVADAVAHGFARLGDRVLLVGRDRTVDERVAALRAAGARCEGYAVDLADADAVMRLASTIATATGGRLDAVVHAAGGWVDGADVADSTAEYWTESLSRNLLTAAYVARAFTPLVRATRGAFVFFASEAALPGARVGGLAAYAAAKAGVVVLTRALAREERRNGVRANALAPGAMRTAANLAAMGADGRFVELDDVVAAVTWLCSPASAGVSGEVLRLAPPAREPPGDG